MLHISFGCRHVTVLDAAGDVVRFVHVWQCHHGIGAVTIISLHTACHMDAGYHVM